MIKITQFMKKLKLHFVKVFTTDVELELTIPVSTTGFQLFQQVCETIGIREVWYFGMTYVDKYNDLVWLDLRKNIIKQTGENKGTIYLKFCIKYFPEDVQTELIFEATQRLFYLHAKECILEGRIDCSFETAVLLASYACQIKYGDFDEETMTAGFLTKEKLVSQKVLEREQCGIVDVENVVIQWYRQHMDMFVSDAMLEYLRVCQELEMYGVTYFSMKNKRGTDILLGVSAAGLNVYSTDDRSRPKMNFPWSEIATVNFRKSKFVITPVDKKSKSLVLFSSHTRYNRRLFSICIGTHELYTRRRCPEPIEVKHMRAQAEAERMQRLKERARLSTALQAQLLAERRVQLLAADVALAKAEQDRADHCAKELARRVEELEHQLFEESRLRAQLEAAEQRLIEHNNALMQICEKNEGEHKRLLEEKSTIESQIVTLQRSVLRSSVKVDQHRAAIAKMSHLNPISVPSGPMPTVTDYRDRQWKRVGLRSNNPLYCDSTSMAAEQIQMSSSHPITPVCSSNAESHITCLTVNMPQISKTESVRSDSDTTSLHPFTPDRSMEIDAHQHRHECFDDLSDVEYKEKTLRRMDTENQNGLHDRSCGNGNQSSDSKNDCRRHTIYSEFNLKMPDKASSDGQPVRQNSTGHSRNDSYNESFNKIRRGNTKKHVDVFESM